MTPISHSGDKRPQRADASLNKGRVLKAARRALADKGSEVSLEQIARDAGVGIGTLYRHFPTREDLIDAVHESEVTALIEAASELAAKNTSVEALHAWMLLFLDFVETQQPLKELADLLIGGFDPPRGGTAAKLAAPIGMLAERAEADGLRLHLAPLDMLRAIVGIRTVRPTTDWKRQATSLVRLFVRDGKCPRATGRG